MAKDVAMTREEASGGNNGNDWTVSAPPADMLASHLSPKGSRDAVITSSTVSSQLIGRVNSPDLGELDNAEFWKVLLE